MPDGVTGIVLAGGQGRRMGTVDKGLQLLHAKPMVEHVLERLAPQVDALIINANQNPEAYATLGEPFGARVVPDRIGGFAGPLAGLQAGLVRRGDAARRHRPLRFAVPAADLVARCATRWRRRTRSSPSRRPATSRIRCSRWCAPTSATI
jgi:molybdopterin-guanine dinucleotide biosynthesis protein A